MRGLLRSYTLWISVFLAVPTLLILVSWNALPGQKMYPLKRGLEEVPRIALGKTSVSADYEVALADRRFSEATTLIKADSNLGLSELTSSIKVAQKKVTETKNSGAREKLVENLIAYDAKLEQQKQVIISQVASPKETLPTNQVVTAPTAPTPVAPTPTPSPSVAAPSPRVNPPVQSAALSPSPSNVTPVSIAPVPKPSETSQAREKIENRPVGTLKESKEKAEETKKEISQTQKEIKETIKELKEEQKKEHKLNRKSDEKRNVDEKKNPSN